MGARATTPIGYLFARRKEDPASTTDAGISAPGGLSQGTIHATEKVAPSRGSQQTPAGGHKRSPPGGPLEKREIPEKPLPQSAGRAIAHSPTAGTQGALLLPIDSGGSTEPRAGLASFNPSPELLDWAAAKHGINALADDILGKFVDHQLATGKRPHDLDAAYRIWIRNEA